MASNAIRGEKANRSEGRESTAGIPGDPPRSLQPVEEVFESPLSGAGASRLLVR
jgi:hypothetical protein